MTPPTKNELLALRGPLCSAEIAASLLERETLGPARRLAEAIRVAISEVDDRIEFLARELFAAEPTARQRHSVAALFGDVMQRVLPAIAARGVTLTRSDGDADAKTETPALLRRCLIAVLRFGSASSESPALSVGWVARGEQLGVRIEAEVQVETCSSERALEELRRFAERERIEIELVRVPEDGAIDLIAWLPTTAAGEGQ